MQAHVSSDVYLFTLGSKEMTQIAKGRLIEIPCLYIYIHIVCVCVYFFITVYNLNAGFIILKAQLAKNLCVQGGHYDLLRCVFIV